MNNPGVPFNQKLIDSTFAFEAVVVDRIVQLKEKNAHLECSRSSLEALVSCLDLTSLSGDDTPQKIEKLLLKALSPVPNVDKTVAAVCLYQPFVRQAAEVLGHSPIQIATVSGGFPSGQMNIDVKCKDIEKSVELGATEIDVVINRTFPLTNDWKALYDEVSACRKACGNARLKVIIATGELTDYTCIARTSWVCMMAGADFIKTSTGMEKVNATLEAGYVMMRAIGDYNLIGGFEVGFKPAGGIRTTEQALLWLALLREELGENYANEKLFRIGASSLLDDLALKF